MDPSQLSDPKLTLQPPASTLKRRLIRYGIVALVVATLAGAGYAAIRFAERNRTQTSNSPPVSDPVTPDEQSKLSNTPLGPTQLQVTELVAERAQLGVATAGSLQITGNLTVGGNGVFTGNISAANFQGGGAGLSNVNAALLNGQPGSFYLDLGNSTGTVNAAQLPSTVALRNATNTFTANNAFSANITVGGALTATGALNAGATTLSSLTLGTPLPVSSGGTGVGAVAGQGVLYGSGGGSLNVAVPAGAGLCLLSGATDVSWGVCGGGGAGVASLNGLTGVLSIANASGAGSTITINDATTAAKGIASFNATNFSVASGAVNTIQDIDVTAAPTFAGLTATGVIDAQGGLLWGGDNYLQTSSSNRPSDITGILLPLYIYPTGGAANADYNNLIALKKKYHNVPLTVVINPASGPGGSTDANYELSIKRLHGAGITVLGYVDTNYTAVSEATAEADVDDWLTYYPEIDGIFFDRMTSDNNGAHFTYYANLKRYAHGKSLYPAVGNPGVNIDQGYYDNQSADIYTIHEGSAYAAEADLHGDVAGGNADYHYRQRAALVYNQGSFDFDELKTMRKYLGNVYVTSGVLPNPWDTIPSYMESIFQALNNANDEIVDNLTVQTALVANTLTSNSTGVLIDGAAADALIIQSFQNGGSGVVLNVQQSDGDSVFRVNDTGTLAVGNATNVAGTLSIGNGAGGDFGEIKADNLTANHTYQLPDVDGTICTSAGNCGSATGTLQAAYTFSAGGSTPEIKLDSSRVGIEIQDADSTIGAGNNFLSLRAPNGGGLGNIVVGFGIQGNIYQRPTANRTDLLDINDAADGNLLTLDSSNGRLGFNLGSTNVPNLTGNGIHMTGALKITGSGSSANFDQNCATPGTTLPARLCIVPDDNSVGFFGSIAQMGLTAAADPQPTAAVFSAFDARTVAHQPTIRVYSPNEANTMGFTWDGSNTQANLITNHKASGDSPALNLQSGNTSANGDSGAVFLQSGSIAGGTNEVSGNLTIKTGNAAGTGADSGSITIDTGTAADVVGGITIGGSNAPTIGIGKTSGTNTATTVNGTALFKNVSNSTTAFQIQNASSGSLFNVDTAGSNLTLAGNNNADLSSFTTNATTFPAQRYGHGTIVANGYIYVIGGFDNTNTPVATTYYAKLNANGSIGTWNSTTSLPLARGNLSVVTSNGYVYALGGYQTGGGASQTTVYYAKLNLDGTIGTWSTTTALADARAEHTSVVANGYVYVIAGRDAGTFNTTTTYYAKLNANGTVGSWTLSGNALAATRIRHASVAANGFVYAIGGLVGGASSSSVEYAALNTDGSIGTWASTNSLTDVRYDGAAAVLNGYVYFLGGENTDNTIVQYAALNSSGTVGSWSTITGSMNAGRRQLTAAAVNGYLYALGGEVSTVRDTQEYASPTRILLGGALDLVGLSGEDLISGTGSGSGGQLTAGNTLIAGSLNVTGSSLFKDSVGIQGAFTVFDQANFQVDSNTTTAFTVQNASGVSLFTVDSTNARLYVGPTAGDTVGTLLVLGNKTNSGDPTGVDGAMYYNSSMAAFRCYENGAWRYCNDPVDLSRGYHLDEDFISTDAADGQFGEYSWDANNAGAGSGVNSAAPDVASRMGQLLIETGTTNSGHTAIYQNGAFGQENVMIGGGEVIEMAINIPTLADVTDDYVLRVGLCDTVGSTDCDDGVYFEYDRSTSANWRYATAADGGGAGARTKNSSTKAVATGWTNLRIVATSSTSVTFYVKNDGETTWTNIGTNSANVPNTSGNVTQPEFNIVKTAGTANRTVRIDYFQMRNSLTTAR